MLGSDVSLQPSKSGPKLPPMVTVIALRKGSGVYFSLGPEEQWAYAWDDKLPRWVPAKGDFSSREILSLLLKTTPDQITPGTRVRVIVVSSETEDEPETTEERLQRLLSLVQEELQGVRFKRP